MTDVARPFAGIKLTRDHCAGLREVVRPYNEIELDPRIVEDFCERLYLAYYMLEADPDIEAVGFPISHDEVMVINHFVSAEDGGWSAELLHQTRQALYEQSTGKDAVRLASSEETHALFQDTALEGDNLPTVPEKS